MLTAREQENMLDYTFYKLAIPTGIVQHPVVMTEALCNPNYSRSRERSITAMSQRPL